MNEINDRTTHRISTLVKQRNNWPLPRLSQTHHLNLLRLEHRFPNMAVQRSRNYSCIEIAVDPLGKDFTTIKKVPRYVFLGNGSLSRRSHHDGAAAKERFGECLISGAPV